MPPALPQKRVLHSKPWQTMRRGSIPVKGKTTVRVKVDARATTTVARAKTLAKAKALRHRRKQAASELTAKLELLINWSQRLKSLTPIAEATAQRLAFALLIEGQHGSTGMKLVAIAARSM
jgi:transcriptional regulator of aromatic amino acid metabolism